jgi:hypothetical protein
MTRGVRRTGAAGALLALCVLVAVGCSGGSGSGSRTLRGTATFPELVGGGPVARSRFIVLDLRQPGAPMIAEGRSDDAGNWAVPNAEDLAVAVIFQRADNAKGVRVSGLAEPGETGLEKSLDGQTDIACEAGVTAVLQGLITGFDVNKNLILRLEAMTERFVTTTDYRNPQAVSDAALQVRRLVLGR